MCRRPEAEVEAGEEEADAAASCSHRGDRGAASAFAKLRADENGVDLLHLVQGGVGKRLVQVGAVSISSLFLEARPALVCDELQVRLVFCVNPNEPLAASQTGIRHEHVMVFFVTRSAGQGEGRDRQGASSWAWHSLGGG